MAYYESKAVISYQMRSDTFKERLTYGLAFKRFVEEKKSLCELAEEIGVMESTIKKHLKTLGIYQLRLQRGSLQGELLEKPLKILAEELWLKPSTLKRIFDGDDIFRPKIKHHVGEVFISRDGYRKVQLKEYAIPEHVLIWTNAFGPPKGVIHHRNGNRLDNRIENFEDVPNEKHLQLHRLINRKRLQRTNRECSIINLGRLLQWLENGLIMPCVNFTGLQEKVACSGSLPD